MRDTILHIALNQFGVKEISGEKDNPEVLKYFNDIGFDGTAMKDETAWCSAFMNWVALQANAERTNKLNARSWLTVGVETKSPKQGDIVILWRESPSSWKGHVGVFIRKSKDKVYILGGNQNNQVNIKAYSAARVLAYKTLKSC
ncbi:TIGR02594 family protein [Kordia sp. TARA_039_SRF]|nr:TIGR02594 family protein [Kordia sp. TARA_039_SRF]